MNEFPDSQLATLAKEGIVYSGAKAANPSDSYPGTAAFVAGCSPRTHGLYWDDSYSRDLYPPGSDCTGPIGTEVDLSEGIDIDASLLTGGGGFNISLLTQRLTSWGTCVPVFPFNYIRTNTIFEVARQNGLSTAYADKHLSYSFVDGPSGLGLVEGYFPEVSSAAATDTAQNAWDDLHWAALNNWLSGKYVNGSSTPFGSFNLVGANFQALTNAQTYVSYVSSNSTTTRSYATPSANITAVLGHFDSKLAEFVSTLKAQGIWNETLLVIGSKQGQTPVDKSKLQFIDPQALINATGVTVNFVTSADWALMYLNDSTDAYTAKANLLASNKAETAVAEVLAGDEIRQYGWGDPFTDPRAPDLLVKGVYGTLFKKPKGFEDHGGWYADDSDVLLMATSGCALANAGKQYGGRVDNQQVAVTLLEALGIPLAQLDGYRIEGTPSLPHIFT